MAGEKHLLVTAQGSYVGASLSTEGWQVGLRFAAAPGAAMDPVGTISNAWDPAAATVARTETDWRIDGNWYAEGGTDDLDVGDWLNDQLAPAFTTWMGANLVHSQCRLDSLKVYPIGAPSGNSVPAPPYATGSPVTLTWTSNSPVGGGGGNMLPPQTSIVASHRTGQIGRRGRGRMYLPPTGASGLDASTDYGRVAAGYQAGVLAAQVALLEDCALNFGGPGFQCVPSIIGAPWTSYAFITSVQVGDVFDTQRRRRAQLSENVSSSAVTY